MLVMLVILMVAWSAMLVVSRTSFLILVSPSWDVLTLSQMELMIAESLLDPSVGGVSGSKAGTLADMIGAVSMGRARKELRRTGEPGCRHEDRVT